MHLVIISGMSGAGKSYALHSLEDVGYYCIDNLPSQLLEELLTTPQIATQTHLAIGIDIRGGQASLEETPAIIERIRQRYPHTHLIYLYAKADVLLKRYNESRRRHPLDTAAKDLKYAIAMEETLLTPLAQMADLRIDTSKKSVYELGQFLRKYLDHPIRQNLTLLFQSFGFKHEAPNDSDFIFDVRCLPNPYWEQDIRHHTGLEQPIIEWLEQQPSVEGMFEHIRDFLDYWLAHAESLQRAYLTVSIGCTGGRHRSVYIAERLYQNYQARFGEQVLIHHRELQKH